MLRESHVLVLFAWPNASNREAVHDNRRSLPFSRGQKLVVTLSSKPKLQLDSVTTLPAGSGQGFLFQSRTQPAPFLRTNTRFPLPILYGLNKGGC